MAHRNNLLLLFERPNEPIFMQRGNIPTVFELPDRYYTDRYSRIGGEVSSRFGEQAEVHIPVREISIPDLRSAMSLGRDEQFSLWIPRHRKIARHLIDIFMGMRSIDDLQSVAVYAHDRVNSCLFNYALSVAILHRPDTKGMNPPTFVKAFPEKFADSSVFRALREEMSIDPKDLRIPIHIPRDYTASDLEPEHRLWYFREDIGVNLHHWHWHLVYPNEAEETIVNKDRRGELFYYMHQQIIARYNAERFSNNLGRVVRFNNLREPIAEGYFPKMDSSVASRAYPPRFGNTKLSDLNRPKDQIKIDIATLESWRDRILEAIHRDIAVDKNNRAIPLDNERGIDILGNMIESSVLSPDRGFYGDLHNYGHLFFAYSHDPDNRHLENLGVMGESETAMRDPVFYRWHAYINDIFDEHKRRLNPYTRQELGYDGITITGIQVSTDGGQANVLNTFWQESDVEISKGINFAPRGDIWIRHTHLQHTPFTYTINVASESEVPRYGTVRIFLAPKTDERGQPMSFQEQRLLMIEMDKFAVILSPGLNTIRRRSVESTVTIPFERTFRNLDSDFGDETSTESTEFNFCGCGWPHHMLIPKGLPQGMPFELFVMISNYGYDHVDQDLEGACTDSFSYCGLRDRLYPDRLPMGFPFDRLPRRNVDRLINFLTPNMSIVDIEIRHENRTISRHI